MKKLLGIIVLGLLLCTPSYSHDEERFIFLSCNGEFPSSLSSIYNEELIKIDLKKSKIIFTDGYEFIANRKKGWDVKAHDFESYSGIRRSGSLDMIDHKEYFSIDRFTGEGVFFMAKLKKANGSSLKKDLRLNVLKLIERFK